MANKQTSICSLDHEGCLDKASWHQLWLMRCSSRYCCCLKYCAPTDNPFVRPHHTARHRHDLPGPSIRSVRLIVRGLNDRWRHFCILYHSASLIDSDKPFGRLKPNVDSDLHRLESNTVGEFTAFNYQMHKLPSCWRLQVLVALPPAEESKINNKKQWVVCNWFRSTANNSISDRIRQTKVDT